LETLIEQEDQDEALNSDGSRPTAHMFRPAAADLAAQGLQASPERTLEAAAEPLAHVVDVDQNVAQLRR
jgi:hypothetical protein